jgi:hypothetical protein
MRFARVFLVFRQHPLVPLRTFVVLWMLLMTPGIIGSPIEGVVTLVVIVVVIVWLSRKLVDKLRTLWAYRKLL